MLFRLLLAALWLYHLAVVVASVRSASCNISSMVPSFIRPSTMIWSSILYSKNIGGKKLWWIKWITAVYQAFLANFSFHNIPYANGLQFISFLPNILQSLFAKLFHHQSFTIMVLTLLCIGIWAKLSSFYQLSYSDEEFIE